MSYHVRLLDQARHLCKREPRRPQQASLRRAVSTAYYALFHLLVDEACNRIVSGGGSEREARRHALRRAFGHAEMKTVSKAYAAGTLPQTWVAASGGIKPSTDLRVVADVFVELQEARHEADYDFREPFARKEALRLVGRCEVAFDAWGRCRRTDEADTYLLALLVNKAVKG